MQLTTDDPLAGLDTPDGVPLRPHDGVIDVPEQYRRYAEQAARVAPLFRVRTRQWGGFDAAALQARYAAWKEQQR